METDAKGSTPVISACFVRCLVHHAHSRKPTSGSTSLRGSRRKLRLTKTPARASDKLPMLAAETFIEKLVETDGRLGYDLELKPEKLLAAAAPPASMTLPTSPGIDSIGGPGAGKDEPKDPSPDTSPSGTRFAATAGAAGKELPPNDAAGDTDDAKLDGLTFEPPTLPAEVAVAALPAEVAVVVPPPIAVVATTQFGSPETAPAAACLEAVASCKWQAPVPA